MHSIIAGYIGNDRVTAKDMEWVLTHRAVSRQILFAYSDTLASGYIVTGIDWTYQQKDLTPHQQTEARAAWLFSEFLNLRAPDPATGAPNPSPFLFVCGSEFCNRIWHGTRLGSTRANFCWRHKNKDKREREESEHRKRHSRNGDAV